GKAPAGQNRPAAPQAAARTGGDAQGRNGSGGWLSDLLSRASLDDDEDVPPLARSGDKAGEKGKGSAIGSAATAKAGGSADDAGAAAIDSISSNIARMIEHPAAVDLWERYRRGETNLFTRRLYTAEGQRTFDEIHRRYRAEPDFRRTVDHYVREFERLLGEVSRTDQDPRRANAYLTSESGKVYTMLAHASGRFEGA
ncbi:hypothetical protein, partial [Methylobacterium ajmalii]